MHTVPFNVMQAPVAATRPTRWGWNSSLLGRISGPHVRIWGILLVSLYGSVGQYLQPDCPYPFPLAFLVSLMYTGGMWEGAHRIIMALRKYWPDRRQTVLRLVVQSLLIVAHVAGYKVLGSLFEIHVLNSGKLLSEEFWGGFRFALSVSAVVTLLYEAAYFFDEWRRSALRAEMLQAETALSQLEALKQQVDPHFLFNSLNTLAALIGPNPDAQNYLERLADVYRYVLLAKNRNLVPATDELEFLRAYEYLNRIRYRDNFRIDYELDGNLLRQYLPPLSLQLLVENAFKHNSVSPGKPLHIRVYQPQPGYLAVSNNLQAKATLVHGTGQGLENIRKRFSLMTERPVHVANDGRQFEVRIPVFADNFPES